MLRALKYLCISIIGGACSPERPLRDLSLDMVEIREQLYANTCVDNIHRDSLLSVLTMINQEIFSLNSVKQIGIPFIDRRLLNAHYSKNNFPITLKFKIQNLDSLLLKADLTYTCEDCPLKEEHMVQAKWEFFYFYNVAWSVKYQKEFLVTLAKNRLSQVLKCVEDP